ncbi:hypothetical protein PR048_020469 [Dryococelus australis]|uniref:Uncharacterized protein n=1 Tax=Dryococelus australis TaxID=614101 RepID=A0ABQ9H6H3_9NEOP|nr:hypothetical protein PR048_020469 [Dryococelus australis]
MESKDQPLELYHINTVTYGLSLPPFPTLRTLHQHAEDNKEVYGSATSVILADTYVNDVVTDVRNVTCAAELRQDLRELLSQGFQLYKFNSNCPAVLEGFLSRDMQLSSTSYSLHENQQVKVLGL